MSLVPKFVTNLDVEKLEGGVGEMERRVWMSSVLWNSVPWEREWLDRFQNEILQCLRPSSLKSGQVGGRPLSPGTPWAEVGHRAQNTGCGLNFHDFAQINTFLVTFSLKLTGHTSCW